VIVDQLDFGRSQVVNGSLEEPFQIFLALKIRNTLCIFQVLVLIGELLWRARFENYVETAVMTAVVVSEKLSLIDSNSELIHVVYTE
jgi:hypothetical protein